MPKHNFMISRAVDLVARKLAGMDSDTVSRITHVLSEEAQMISNELQQSGENVDADILAARLEGIVARVKYEARNQGPDPSPYEFPIFNVSHNPAAPYPNPINHLYDKRYKEAYSTFITQNQPTSSSSQKSESSTPALLTRPSPSKPTVNSNSSAKPTVGPSSSAKPTTNSNSPSYHTYSQGQHQQKSNNQKPHPPGFLPGFRQQSADGWQYINPYAVMPSSQTAYYQQPIQEQPPTTTTQPVRRSSTGDDLHSNSLSHAASNNDLNYPTNSGKEKIRVRVVNDSPASSSAGRQISTPADNWVNSSNLTLKSNNINNNNNEMLTKRTIYTSPNTEINSETMEEILKVVDHQRSEAAQSTATPVAERIIIIDRRGSSTPDNNPNSSGKERFRTFEIRTSTPGSTPSSPSATATTSPPSSATSTTATPQVLQQPNYYAGHQLFYQQPKMYSSVPSNLYSTVTPYIQNGFYPFGYYHY